MSLVTTTSPHSVSATSDRLLSAVAARGIQVFARVDHAAGARAAGLELPDEEVVIFGDPRVGTLLMQSDRQIGYELPLRVLVWDAEGQTMVGYRLPTELSLDYEVNDKLIVLERMTQLVAQLVAESVADE